MFLVKYPPVSQFTGPGSRAWPSSFHHSSRSGDLASALCTRTGAARGKVPCYLRLSFQTQPSVAETHVSVRLPPGFKTCGTPSPGRWCRPPFPRSDGSAASCRAQRWSWTRILVRAGTGCFRYSAVLATSSVFSFLWLLSLLVLQACGAPGTGLHSRLPAVVRRHCRVRGRGGGSPGAGAH